jgi:two-component system nitrogen regulation sensor histidine kinase NtrY
VADQDQTQRRAAAWILGVLSLLVLLFLITENAFNLKSVAPRSSGSILIFTSISALSFLLFLLLVVLLSRNILKLYADGQSRVLGSRLRTRMLAGALLLSLIPASFMVFFNFLLMNRSIDRWFSQPGVFLRERLEQVSAEMARYAAENARAEAESLANAPAVHNRNDARAILAEMHQHKITLQGGFAVVYRDDELVSAYQVPTAPGAADAIAIDSWIDPGALETVPASQPISATILQAAQRPDEPILRIGAAEYALGVASTANGAVVVVGLPLPQEMGSAIRSIRTTTETYWALYHARRRIRATYLLLMLLLAALTFFIGSWLALFLSKQVTRPVEMLADSMDTIASGDYTHRVDIAAAGELGELVRSFNHMAADLESSRAQLEASTQQLSAANAALESRRKELETVLETIPSGVAVLDADLRILQTNRAFCEMLDPQGVQAFEGQPLLSIVPVDAAEEIERTLRRSQRLAAASTEMETGQGQAAAHLALTAVPLHTAGGNGYLIVLDNVTDLLLVQKQMAWKEVAQRVAHEIKNPLTPIALSAERTQRQLERAGEELPAETKQRIHDAMEVIRASVETLRLLVGQFSALADFPAAQPQPVALQNVVEATLRIFAGRLEGIEIVLHLEPDLPPVLADPEAMQRALTNLIDNAAEAMRSSLVRVLTVHTGWNETQTMAEIVVADTGHGLTEEMRERLFLPFFSTRRRGTGLGLAIAAKIVQEHHGSIRAESNQPAGARFIVELPFAEPVHAGAALRAAREEAPQ